MTPRRPDRFLLPFVSAAFFAAIVAASLGACSEPTTCTREDGCTCDEGKGSCDLACAGEGCEFVCPDNLACSFACDGGGCKATGTSKSSFELDCAGHGCSVVCDELLYTAGPDNEGFTCEGKCDCH